MVNIAKINNLNFCNSCFKKDAIPFNSNSASTNPINSNYTKYTSDNLKAYIPSFTAKNRGIPSEKVQIKTVKSLLDKESALLFKKLEENGILEDKSSNDGSSVLYNMYKIATEPRFQGLSANLILKETIKALENPFSITQKFGDIPKNITKDIEKETNEKFPQEAYAVTSSTCVATSMEFNLAMRKPAEFVRFVEGLSSKDYCVTKNINLSLFSEGPSAGIDNLRKFNTETTVAENGKDLSIKIKPDRKAIIRARVQSSYKDENERSCIDVLIQSAILNLCSQNTYDSLTDERNNGEFNSERHGLSDYEKNFGEEIIFETPKISVVYQNLDDSKKISGYNCELSEIKQHILKSLELGQNVIIGYTHFDSENRVDGGHEITIIGYEKDKNGNGQFICNDTDDNISAPITIEENSLLPLIHHAGIPKEALSKNDSFVEPWKIILENFQSVLKQEKEA